MGKRRNPAVVAGLAGAFAFAAPSYAQALTVGEAASAVFSTPETAFVAGGVMGAAVAGIVSGIVCHALLAADSRRGSGAEELAGQTGRMAAPRASIDAPEADEAAEAEARALLKDDADASEPAAPAKKPKHMRPAGAAAKPAKKAESPKPAEPEAEAPAVPAAAKPTAAQAPARTAGVTEAAKKPQPPAPATPAPAAEAPAKKPQPAAPLVDEASRPIPIHPAATTGALPRRPRSHEATDYEQIAANYVARANFRERMATRAQGVAQTLAERMGRSMMDGLPVISRADGSVADVGTSWWNTSVGLGSVTKIEDYVDGDSTGDLAIPSEFSTDPKAQLAEAAQNAAAEFARADISDRVAFVDEGVYPERRRVSDDLVEDDWASALRSMDERLNSQFQVVEPIAPMAFSDVVGDADTLDEPDGLEQSTSFLPFKTPAGHPEVVDTETYVDYLIGDEFGRNSSKAARSGAGRFLRLLEGGTSTNRLNRVDDAPARPRAKHFAEPELAAEA